MRDLLPCPFCGGEAIRVDVGLSEFVDGEVTCEDCGGNVGNYPTKADAIAAWNRRALPAVQPAHVNETPKSEHEAAVMLTPATKGGAHD